MSHQGKTQLTIVFTAPPDLVAEGDRIFASHAKWMRNTHSREGEKALLHYNVVKGPELSNPMDPSSKPTGDGSSLVGQCLLILPRSDYGAFKTQGLALCRHSNSVNRSVT